MSKRILRKRRANRFFLFQWVLQVPQKWSTRTVFSGFGTFTSYIILQKPSSWNKEYFRIPSLGRLIFHPYDPPDEAIAEVACAGIKS